MAGKGHAQGRLCPALVAANGAQECLRRVLHLQKHGSGANLPHHRPEISHQRPQLPHHRQPAQPLHPLLLLHSRRSAWPHRDVRGFILPVQDNLLPSTATASSSTSSTRRTSVSARMTTRFWLLTMSQ